MSQAAQRPDHSPADADGVLTVVDLGRPDVVHEFSAEGQRRSFGRGAECDIVIAGSGERRLSALAGIIWRMDGELWLRNVSLAHDLYVEVPGLPPEPPLPPRRSETDRGPARSIPGDLAFVNGPDGCRLRVRQILPENPLLAGSGYGGDPEKTMRVPPVPTSLRDVAQALCAPLLEGGQLPASYAQISAATGITSRKSVRNKVEQLTALYLDEIPALRSLLDDRLEREAAQLGLPSAPRVGGATRSADPRADVVDTAEQERRSALALPTYYEVAHLLVRRGLVTSDGAGPAPAPAVEAEGGRPGPKVVRIGRAPSNALVLGDPSVSREHAELLIGDGTTEIRDLGSGNGTFVNGVQIRRRKLNPGDLLTIGKFTLRYDGRKLAMVRRDQ
ncbi:FHA domain-containing protein [Spongisporangium articulatum]|uniref:FHA domain-containing protein n=1 Tax=Spongisporangium articulatum TaxID=3362603 RepID=A0ABW8AT19_9ACTN